MIYTPDELLKLIHDTRALSIWNREKGPVFWYIAGVPGPFYINTELLLGEKLAAGLLKEIDNILATTPANDPAARSVRLGTVIMDAYEGDAAYRRIVSTMTAQAKKEFPVNSFSFISGGERRDWLFSIPFAREYRLKHAYLFKNKTMHCEQPLKNQEAGLHVSDLINNAVSYTDMWLPMLVTNHLKCAGTACIISRGSNGIDNLEKSGIKVVALNNIDLDFFKRSQTNGIIGKDRVEEIELFFSSPKEWAATYLMGKPNLFEIKDGDKKSRERMRSFFANDPWELRAGNEAFFAAMLEKTAN